MHLPFFHHVCGQQNIQLRFERTSLYMLFLRSDPCSSLSINVLCLLRTSTCRLYYTTRIKGYDLLICSSPEPEGLREPLQCSTHGDGRYMLNTEFRVDYNIKPTCMFAWYSQTSWWLQEFHGLWRWSAAMRWCWLCQATNGYLPPLFSHQVQVLCLCLRTYLDHLEPVVRLLVTKLIFKWLKIRWLKFGPVLFASIN
jgi:hypothetical protein